MATMRLLQFREDGGATGVAVVEGDALQVLRDVPSVFELARHALAEGDGLAAAASRRRSGRTLEYSAIERDGRLLPPITHPVPSRLLVTGTGLTHVGSAQARDQMHETRPEATADESDAMKMFRLGITAGKPPAGEIGAQPEWFYKGDGDCLVPSGVPISMPSFALAAGEEPEIAGVYLIDESGVPWRIGFTLANDFSDHVTERKNYMYIAHSKLRECPLGPELLLGALPHEIRGESRLLRGGSAVWHGAFLSGEDHMSYSIATLEHHHFKYPAFRRPGDLHVHLFGCPVLSFAENVPTKDGDVFEFDVPAFGHPLRNRLAVDQCADRLIEVGVL